MLVNEGRKSRTKTLAAMVKDEAAVYWRRFLVLSDGWGLKLRLRTSDEVLVGWAGWIVGRAKADNT